jgi:hypothetical protein
MFVAILAALLLTLSTPAATPEATPIVLNTTLAIEAYPPGEAPESIPVADIGGPLQLTPGSERLMVIGTYECCYVFEPSEVEAIWTVSPVEGVTIDNTGILTVGEGVPNGTVLSVTANRDPVGPSVSVLVYVYSEEEQPLVGLWREEAGLACDTGERAVPGQPIGELRFDADGTFSVTWHPFEIYRDYWGTYEADLGTGRLALRIESGNIPTPAGFDGEGTFAVEAGGSLVLTGIWLGSSPGSDTARPACGHVFSRM